MNGRVGWKEDWKKDLVQMTVRFVLGGLIAAGIILLAANGKDFLTALKPGYDVEYLLENGAEEGMHVSGRVPGLYDCFAELENTGSSKISAYYYAIPGEKEVMVLYVPAARHGEAEALLEETVDYLETGLLPESLMDIEGYVVKAEGRIPYLLSQYMLDIGYTQEDIAAMGDPLMIRDAEGRLEKARIFAPVGMILLTLGILLTAALIFYKSARRKRCRQ